MEDNIFYSATTNGFYPQSLFDEYKSAGSLPSDLVEISESEYREFSANHSDKIRVAGQDGIPRWEQVKESVAGEVTALIKEASALISVLSDERDAGIISDDDLSRWKAWIVYRKALRELDVTATDIKLLDKPE